MSTVTQRFTRPTPTEPAVYELWHVTTAGASTSRGLLARGTAEDLRGTAAVIYEGHGDARASGTNTSDLELHLVPAGSYDSFPEPDLGPSNRIDDEPTLAEVAPC